jgi:hypothetical protein
MGLNYNLDSQRIMQDWIRIMLGSSAGSSIFGNQPWPTGNIIVTRP